MMDLQAPSLLGPCKLLILRKSKKVHSSGTDWRIWDSGSREGQKCSKMGKIGSSGFASGLSITTSLHSLSLIGV